MESDHRPQPLSKGSQERPKSSRGELLKSAPNAGAVKALRLASKGPEIIQAKGNRLYIVYPEGIGRSRLTASLMESMLGTTATGRNWKTVLQLGTTADLVRLRG